MVPMTTTRVEHVQLNVRVPKEMAQRVGQEAYDRDTTQALIVQQALEEYFSARHR
jgi:hypothetical protein